MKTLYEHNIAIIGYGRFGKVWANIFLESGYTVMIYDPLIPIPASPPVLIPSSDTHNTTHPLVYIEQEALRNADIVFFCVPISSLQQSIKENITFISPHTIVCDTCSVKTYPMKWMREQLPNTQKIVGLHPLFGPDSVHIAHHRIVIVCREQISDESYTVLGKIFLSANIEVKEISSEEHDKQAVYSQGLTHLLGRVLKKLPLEKKEVSTKGFESLLEIIEQTCEDSYDLFLDIQQYNIGVHNMYADLKYALEETIKAIEPHCDETTYNKLSTMDYNEG